MKIGNKEQHELQKWDGHLQECWRGLIQWEKFPVKLRLSFKTNVNYIAYYNATKSLHLLNGL